jgi:hypothetical protein
VSYNTAWLLKHKLMQAMRERDDGRPLRGAIQIDDAYWGGQQRGNKRGRGAPGKTPFVAAVACSVEGRPQRMRMTPLKGFGQASMRGWAERHLAPECAVVSDGLQCFTVLSEQCRRHQAVLTGGGPASVEIPEFRWINTLLGNVKTALHGTYHAVRSQHLGRYLGAFSYRFNRRFELDQMIERLAYVACRTAPLPYRFATMAEVHT